MSSPVSGVAILAPERAAVPIASSAGTMLIQPAPGILPGKELTFTLGRSREPYIEAIHRDAPTLERTLQRLKMLFKQTACLLVGCLDRAVDTPVGHRERDFDRPELHRIQLHAQRATLLAQHLRQAALELRFERSRLVPDDRPSLALGLRFL